MYNQENEQEQVVSVKKKKTSLIVLGAIALFFYLAIVTIGLIMTIDVLTTEDSLSKGLGAMVLIIVILIYGSLSSLVPTGVSIAGLIVSIKKAKKIGTSKLWTVGFAIMIVLPFLTIVGLLMLLKVKIN